MKKKKKTTLRLPLALLPVACCLLPFLALAQSPKPQSAYDAQDHEALARELRNLKMMKMLETLSADPTLDEFDKLAVNVQLTLAKADTQVEPKARDGLFDEAIALQDKLVEALKSAESEKLRYFRACQDRIRYEGAEKIAPYVEKERYFLAGSGGKAKIAAGTKVPYDTLKKLMRDMDKTGNEWRNNNDMMIQGLPWKIDDLMNEVKYRGAWICLYRGLALPKGDKDSEQEAERTSALNRCLEYAKEYAEADDNSSGVKFESLGMMGRAYVELGQYDKGRQCFKRAIDPSQSAISQLGNMFDTVKSFIREGDPDKAETALGDFKTQGGKIMPGEAGIAVEMQGTLLKWQILLLRSEKVKTKDPKQSEQYGSEAYKVIDDFCIKNPKYKAAFEDIITQGNDDIDPLKVPPPQLSKVLGGLLNQAQDAKRIAASNPSTTTTAPAGSETLAKIEDMCKKVLESKDASPAQRAPALYAQAMARGLAGKHVECIDLCMQFVKEFPDNANVRYAAMFGFQHALLYMDVKNVPDFVAAAQVIGKGFVENTLKLEEVLYKRFASDPEVAKLDLDYHMGRTYEGLGQNKDAIDCYKRISPTSDLYYPATYGVLSSQSRMVEDEKSGDEKMRQAQANILLNGLANYRDKAREFTSNDAKRQARVRFWAVLCDLERIELLDHVLKNTGEAGREAKAALDRWKDLQGEQLEQVQEVVIVTLLDKDPDQAVKILLDSKVVGGTAGRVVMELRKEIEDIRSTDPESDKLKNAMKSYQPVAERLYKSMPANIKEEQAYPFKQAMAYGLEMGSAEDAAKALDMFAELGKLNPRDSANVWGQARASTRMGKYKEALAYYDALRMGLEPKNGDKPSPELWRAHIERIRLGVLMYRSEPKGLKGMQQDIKVLQFTDPQMGGHVDVFNGLTREIENILGAQK